MHISQQISPNTPVLWPVLRCHLKVSFHQEMFPHWKHFIHLWNQTSHSHSSNLMYQHSLSLHPTIYSYVGMTQHSRNLHSCFLRSTKAGAVSGVLGREGTLYTYSSLVGITACPGPDALLHITLYLAAHHGDTLVYTILNKHELPQEH